MFRQALRLLRREALSGELRLLLAALIIGVASLASVSFYTDRLAAALDQRKAEWLGGDLVVSANQPLPDRWREQAEQSGVEQSSQMTFRSVVVSGEQMALSEVKAVDAAYPLRGTLSLVGEGDQPRVVAGAPPPGEVWVEAMLLHKLGIEQGATLQLGRVELVVSGVIHNEPDRGTNFINMAPRIIVNEQIILASELIQPGSRVNYQLSLAGASSAIAALQRTLEPQLRNGDRLTTEPDRDSATGTALERGQRFLQLVSMVGFVLAAVAVGMSAHRYALRHLESSAIYRCLGASARWVLGLYTTQLLLLGLLGSVVGVLLGYLAQLVLEQLLLNVFAVTLPAATFTPLLLSLLAGLLITIGFGLPPLYRLREVRPVRILRADLPAPQLSAWLLYLPPLLTIVLLLLLQGGELLLTALVIAGVALTMLFLVAGALLLIHLARRIEPRGVVMRFALTGMTRRSTIAVLQIAAVGTGLMVLLLLSVVSRELLQSWDEGIPDDAPNLFMINVQQAQVAGISDFLAARGQRQPRFYPMVRGRLIAINDQPVSAENYRADRARRLVQREFNLSWTESLQASSPIVSGEPWRPASGEAIWSVEQGIAEELGIRLNDRLTYEIAGQPVEGRVANLRLVDWDTFQVNFFVIAAPGMLDPHQATYISAFHLDSAQQPLLVELVRNHPNLTTIDVAALLQQIRDIILQVTRSVEFVSLFTLAAGFLVLFAAVQTSMDERLRESRILRVLGASRREILRALTTEFALLGLIAGTLAALGAWLVGYLLADQLFRLDYQLASWLWLIGPLAGVVGMTAAGIWATRRVVAVSPMMKG